MLGAIRHALANLTNFKGRDARQTFWYWVLCLFVLRILASFLVAAPMTARIMAATMQAVHAGSQDPAAVQSMTMGIMLEELPRMMWIGMAVGVLTILLMAASLVRRLHDSDLSGWLALLPLGIYALALARMPSQVAATLEVMRASVGSSPPNTFTMMHGQGVTMILGWLPGLFVIAIGVRKSTDGPNRFGADVTRF